MRIHFSIIVPLLISLFLGCAVVFPSTDTNRRLRVKVVADNGFSSDIRWRRNVENMMGVADRLFQSCAEVTLEIDTMYAWDARNMPEYADLPLIDCLMKHVPKGSADLVVYLSKATRDEAYIANAGSMEFGYIAVSQVKTTEDSGYEEAYRDLVQHIGIMFGALRKRRHRADGPNFTDGNVDIMVSLSKRPFSGETWDSTHWEPIHSAYTRVRQTYNPWRFSRTGKIVNHEDNVYAEGDTYLFLSHFASLCGKTDLALSDLDSTEATYHAKWNTCLGEKAGNRRLCVDCSSSFLWATNWLAWRLREVEAFRISTLLRAGREEAASLLIEKMVDNVSQISSGAGMRLFNHFEFLKNVYKADDGTGLRANREEKCGPRT